MVGDFVDLSNELCIINPEEETGSAEGQPASNKVDDYTIIRQRDISCCFFIIGNLYGLKKLIRVVLKMQVPFYKVSFCLYSQTSVKG